MGILMAISTPWGISQTISVLAPGIREVTTASHGGIKLDSERNAMMPDYLRREDGWYEEDCEWARVACIFPQAFRVKDNAYAFDCLKHYCPIGYTKLTGIKLGINDSSAFRYSRDAWADYQVEFA